MDRENEDKDNDKEERDKDNYEVGHVFCTLINEWVVKLCTIRAENKLSRVELV